MKGSKFKAQFDDEVVCILHAAVCTIEGQLQNKERVSDLECSLFV